MAKLFRAAFAVGVAIALLAIAALTKNGTSYKFIPEVEQKADDSWPGGQGNDAGFVARWREILRRVFNEIGSDRVLAVAGGVTFYGLLALFPAITAFVSGSEPGPVPPVVGP